MKFWSSRIARKSSINRLIIVISVCAISMLQSAFAQDTADLNNSGLRALDSTIFSAGIVRRGSDTGREQPLEDQLIFEDGKFISIMCKRYNFEPAPYWVRSDGDRMHFRAELNSPTDGKMVWEGEFHEGKLLGTMHWIKKRWYWTIDVEHTITGVVKETATRGSGVTD